MRLIVLNNKAIGKELAMPIFSQYGNALLGKGSIVTEKSIFRLKKLGISIVYIEDGVHDFTLEEVLDTRMKFELMAKLKKVFTDCRTTERVDEFAVIEIVEKLIDNVSISENAYLFNNISNEEEEMKLILHSIHVAILSIIVGYNKKYDRRKLLKLGIGALLHDIGKLFSSKEDHTTIGYNIMKRNPNFSTTSYCIPAFHHENVDGSGYPEGIRGVNLHEFTKIVSICNEYISIMDAGEGILPHEILEQMSGYSNYRFDEEIFKEFLGSVYIYPNGLTVRLNNDVEAVVILQNKSFPARPVVAFKDEGEIKLCNLMNNLTLFVKDIIL